MSVFHDSVHIALYKPQIPPNTGNIARLCVGIQGKLSIIGTPAFRMDDKSLRRAGIDYWEHLHLEMYPRWKEFIVANPKSRLVVFSKEGVNHLWNFPFSDNDILIFGNEGHGLPPRVLRDYAKTSVRIPMWGEVRSMNLSNSVAVAAYEYLRNLYSNDKIKMERDIPYQRNYYQKK